MLSLKYCRADTTSLWVTSEGVEQNICCSVFMVVPKLIENILLPMEGFCFGGFEMISSYTQEMQPMGGLFLLCITIPWC